MLPAPWEVPYAAQKPQQGGAAVRGTRNKALSSGILASFRCLCAVTADGQQSRKGGFVLCRKRPGRPFKTQDISKEPGAAGVQLPAGNCRKLQADR